VAENGEDQKRDDLFDSGEPFDAGQWALHGLLSAYFDAERGRPRDRARTILDRIAAEAGEGRAVVAQTERTKPRAALRGFVRQARRRWAIGSGLAAAVLVIAIGILTLKTGEQEVLAAIRAVAQQPTITGAGFDTIVPRPGETIEQAFARGLREAEAARERLTECLERAATLSGRAQRDAVAETFHAFTHVYRPLRDLGQWEQALQLARQALDYAQGNNPSNQADIVWTSIYLDDIASIYVPIGEFEQARRTYEQSIAVREQIVEQDVIGRRQAPGYQPDWNRATRIQHRALRVTPLYWRLSYLATLEGDLVEARRWLAVAEKCLYDYFAGVCAAAAEVEGCEPPDLPTLLDAYLAAPEEFRNPPEWPTQEQESRDRIRYGGFSRNSSIVAILRQHLYREARLRRIEGDYLAARQALRDAQQVTYWPVHDESRLDFNEPLEAARIAILLGEPDTALDEIDLAEECTGPRTFYDVYGKPIHHAPIGPLAVAELNAIKAAALLTQPDALVGENQPTTRTWEARLLLERAVTVRSAFLPERIAGPTACAKWFLAASWNALLEVVETVGRF